MLAELSDIHVTPTRQRTSFTEAVGCKGSSLATIGSAVLVVGSVIFGSGTGSVEGLHADNVGFKDKETEPRCACRSRSRVRYIVCKYEGG